MALEHFALGKAAVEHLRRGGRQLAWKRAEAAAAAARAAAHRRFDELQRAVNQVVAQHLASDAKRLVRHLRYCLEVVALELEHLEEGGGAVTGSAPPGARRTRARRRTWPIRATCRGTKSADAFVVVTESPSLRIVSIYARASRNNGHSARRGRGTARTPRQTSRACVPAAPTQPVRLYHHHELCSSSSPSCPACAQQQARAREDGSYCRCPPPLPSPRASDCPHTIRTHRSAAPRHPSHSAPTHPNPSFMWAGSPFSISAAISTFVNLNVE